MRGDSLTGDSGLVIDTELVEGETVELRTGR
jgi:hypothetical protein